MLDQLALENIGIYQSGAVAVSQIVFGDEVRQLCENNVCRRYGTTWACPPAVGTLEQCKQSCLAFENAMVFSTKYQLEDSFDYEGMQEGHRAFKDVCDKLYAAVKGKLPNFLILSNEGCIRCKTCTYPHAACRMPDTLFPSVEGFGIYVNKLAETANIRYSNGANTVTYFGLLLFNSNLAE